MPLALIPSGLCLSQNVVSLMLLIKKEVEGPARASHGGCGSLLHAPASPPAGLGGNKHALEQVTEQGHGLECCLEPSEVLRLSFHDVSSASDEL